MGGSTIAVRGEARVEVDPELARFSVTVVARDKDRERTVTALQQRSDEVLAKLRSFDDAVERIETAAMRLQPTFKDGRLVDKVVGYSATMAVTVTVADLGRLGEVVGAIAGEDLLSISGPWWSLRPDSDVYRRARLAAVNDAVTRARQYAEALGSRVETLVELADHGLLGDTPPDVRPMVAAAMRPPGRGAPAPGSAPDPEFDFEPIRQTATAVVEARFAIAAPDLRAGPPPA